FVRAFHQAGRMREPALLGLEPFPLLAIEPEPVELLDLPRKQVALAFAGMCIAFGRLAPGQRVLPCAPCLSDLRSEPASSGLRIEQRTLGLAAQQGVVG